MLDPADVFLGIQTHVRRHAREEDVLARSQRLDPHGLPLQVANGADSIRPKQLEAPRVDARQHDDRISLVDANDEWPAKFRVTSASPLAKALAVASREDVLTYRTSVNPSPSSSVSATYWGAMQMPVMFTSLSLVVSGGGSAAADLDAMPRRPAVPARVTPRTNSRLFQCRTRSLFI